mmetsp:Transcript_28214/g.56532  ORF Transcript_28214/g.56532 Transcript_28214/m.56532 type:complete len:137 (+) Transcript_28214:105-515(+)
MRHPRATFVPPTSMVRAQLGSKVRLITGQKGGGVGRSEVSRPIGRNIQLKNSAAALSIGGNVSPHTNLAYVYTTISSSRLRGEKLHQKDFGPCGSRWTGCMSSPLARHRYMASSVATVRQSHPSEANSTEFLTAFS